MIDGTCDLAQIRSLCATARQPQQGHIVLIVPRTYSTEFQKHMRHNQEWKEEKKVKQVK